MTYWVTVRVKGWETISVNVTWTYSNTTSVKVHNFTSKICVHLCISVRVSVCAAAGAALGRPRLGQCVCHTCSRAEPAASASSSANLIVFLPCYFPASCRQWYRSIFPSFTFTTLVNDTLYFVYITCRDSLLLRRYNSLTQNETSFINCYAL